MALQLRNDDPSRSVLMQPIPGRASFIAKVQPSVALLEAHNQATN
jgi:hypothetical protein